MLAIIRECARAHKLTRFEDLARFGVTPTQRQRDSINKSVESTFVDAWSKVMVADKFGAATTHWDRLQVRVQRGVGNPCPLVLIGIPSAVVGLTSADGA